MKSIFVIWRDSEDGMWHPVAKLSRSDTGYHFNYTKGSDHNNFIPFPRMGDLSKSYHSTSLFSFFSNRLIPTNRPEFKKMLEWSDINIDLYDEFDLLGISGGARKTDQYRIISQPEATNTGEFKLKFFSNGINYLDLQSIDKISTLKPNEPLLLEFDNTNEYDCNAVMMMTMEPDKIKVGYCPKYFNCDIRSLLTNPKLSAHTIKVVKVNIDAPAQFRLLCEFTTKWPDNFIPMISDDYLAYTKD